MKRMKRTGCLLLCLCMLFSLLPLGTMAEDSLCSTCLTDPCGCLPQCTGDETCTLTEGHKEGCPKTCTGGESCANGHVSPCPLTPAEFDPPQPRGGETLTFKLCNAAGNELPFDAMPFMVGDPARMRIKVSDGSFATKDQITTDPATNITVTEEPNNVLVFHIVAGNPGDSYAIYYKATSESQAVNTGLSVFIMEEEEEESPAFILCNANGIELDFKDMPAEVADPGAMLRIKKDGAFLTSNQIVCKPSDTISVTGGGENSPLVFNITAANTYEIFYKDGDTEINTGISLDAEAPAEIPDFRLFAPNGTELPFSQIEAYLEEGALVAIRLADGTPVTASQLVIDPSENISVSDHNGYLMFNISASGTYKLLYKENADSEAIDTGFTILATPKPETAPFRLFAPNGTYLESGIINITIDQGGTLVSIKLPDDTCITAEQIVLDTDKVTVSHFESTLLMFNASAPGTYNVLYVESAGSQPVDTGLRIVAANNPEAPAFAFYSPPNNDYPDGMKLPFTRIDADDIEPVVVSIRLADGTRVTAEQIFPIEGLEVTDGNNGLLIFNFSIPSLYMLSYRETPDSTPIDTGLSISIHANRLLFYDLEPGQIDPYARVRLETGDSTSIAIRYTPDGTYENSILITADKLTPSDEKSGITLAADPADGNKTIITAGNAAGNWDIFYYPSTGQGGGYSVPVTVYEKGTFSFYLDGSALVDSSIDAVNGTPFSLTIKHNPSGTYVTADQIVPADGLAVTDAEENALLFTPTKEGNYLLSYKADSSSEAVCMAFTVNVTTPSPFLFYDPWGHEFDDLGAMANPHPFGEPLMVKIKHTASGKWLTPSQIVTDEGSSITVSDSTEFVDVVNIHFSSLGNYNLYYKETESSEKVLFGTVEVAPASAGIVEGQMVPGALIARGADLGNGNFNAAYMEPGKSYEVMFAILGQNGITPVDPDLIWSTSDQLKIEKMDGDESLCKITVLSGGNGYFRTENANTPFHAYTYGAEAESFLDDQEELLASEDGSNFVPTLTLAVNEEITVSLRYGSTGASVPVTALKNDVSPKNVVSLAANNDGTFTLKGLKVGTAMLSYESASGEKGLKVNVVAARAENKHLFVLGGASGQATYLSLTPGGSQQATFYFGTFSDYEKVDIHASSNLTVQKNEGGYLVTAGAAGNGLIWYEKDGIAYTMPVMIGTINEASNSQPSNTAVIDGITYTTAMLLEETLEVMPNFGQDYTEESTMDFNQSIVLAAFKNDTLDSGAFSNISDFTASFMYCTEDVDETKPANHAKLSIIAPKVPGSNATTSGIAVQAEATKGFRGMLALSFTVTDPQDSMPRRITLQCPIAYNLRAGDVVITISADSELDTAAELNVVLSSCFAFDAWVSDPGRGVSVTGRPKIGGHYTIHLPSIAYTDGIVVAQMITQPRESGPPNTISLVGHGTTMAGLVSKGGLSSVNGISFVANENVTMTHGGETFTCGILSASDYSDASAPFDAAYAARYCDINPVAPSSMASALQFASGLLAAHSADIKWSSTTIYDLDNCSFEGYDYGVRSTTTGVVGGGSGCSFSYCHYGIYMDSNGFGVSAGNPHNVDYSGYRFLNNKYAVRLVSLPAGATPYVFRVHDSDFDHNHFDFHLTPAGDYYFYRNYFGGYWREHDHHGRWKCFHGQHHFDLDTEEQQHKNNKNEGHRAYRAIEDAGVRIFATLSRDRETNSGYHLYHNRRNRYLKGNGAMPVNGNSIGDLTQRTELEIASESNGQVTVEASFIMGGGRNS